MGVVLEEIEIVEVEISVGGVMSCGRRPIHETTFPFGNLGGIYEQLGEYAAPSLVSLSQTCALNMAVSLSLAALSASCVPIRTSNGSWHTEQRPAVGIPYSTWDRMSVRLRLRGFMTLSSCHNPLILSAPHPGLQVAGLTRTQSLRPQVRASTSLSRFLQQNAMETAKTRKLCQRAGISDEYQITISQINSSAA